jgi:hypothetical protein
MMSRGGVRVVPPLHIFLLRMYKCTYACLYAQENNYNLQCSFSGGEKVKSFLFTLSSSLPIKLSVNRLIPRASGLILFHMHLLHGSAF